LLHLFCKIAIFGVGVLGRLDQKLNAARVGANDAEAVSRLVVRLSSCSCFKDVAMKGCQIRTLAPSVSVLRSISRIEASSTR
jgi:hypothetical protein